METLARWAGYLAIVGGGLMVVVTVATTVDPDSPIWFVFFLVPILLGAAVLGFEQRTRAATGQLGRASAWLSAAGVVALLLVFAYAIATGGVSTDDTYDPASDPFTPFWIATAVAWFVGNLGYAAALIRAKALSPIGAWLVVAGAIVGIVVSAVLGENLPTYVYLLFALFGLGWIVVGYAALRPTGPAMR